MNVTAYGTHLVDADLGARVKFDGVAAELRVGDVFHTRSEIGHLVDAVDHTPERTLAICDRHRNSATMAPTTHVTVYRIGRAP